MGIAQYEHMVIAFGQRCQGARSRKDGSLGMFWGIVCRIRERKAYIPFWELLDYRIG